MTIEEIIISRNIKEILHFTTNKGITGMLSTGLIKSRNLLPKEERLEYIYKYNCLDRSRDKDWWDYVNLSITTVNKNLFDISSGRWHSGEDGWWCILSFDSSICTHEGVYFTTTNNMYTGVKRRQGSKGLEAMFATQIEQWQNKIIRRGSEVPLNQPSCPQAEVLYPNEISLEYLKTVYVSTNEDAAKLDSILSIFSEWKHINCVVNQNLFF